MESTKSPPSVIAKLMKLDHQSPQLPDLKRRRVLSENYLKKSDMIGVHKRSVLNPGISSSGVHQEMSQFDLARFRSTMDRNTNSRKTRIVRSKKECFSTEHPLITEKIHLDELVNRPQDLNCKEVLGYIQHSELHSKNSLQVHELRGHSGYHRAEKSLSIVTDRKCNTFSNIRVNILGDYVFCKGTSEAKVLCNTHPSITGSSLSRLDGKKIFDKWRKNKISETNKLGDIICNGGELFRPTGNEIEDVKSCNQSSQQGQKLPSGNPSDKDGVLEDSSLIESIPPCISETTLADHQHNDVGILSSEFKELLPDPLMKHNSPSKVWGSSSIKTSPYHLNEQRLDAAFSRKARVINSKSPTSVLEPRSLNTPTSDIFESENDDYYVHVQWLNSKSEETYSEGSGLAVSSDEESEEVSFHSSQDTQRILGRYGSEENKKLFYMLDILEKAELTCINSEHYIRAWNSSESLVDPSVFELLELKYGKQTSWEKSERRLLFDRVNVGLKEILNSHIGLCTFETSLRRRFTAALRKNEVKEELWMFLTNEEKDACKDMSDKEPYKEQKWFHISEDVQTICEDIENVLFAELVGEIVNFPSL